MPLDKKEAAREGLIQVGREMELGDTALWTRVNELASPFVLEDLMRIVAEIGDKIEVIMVPKVEGPWDIHYVDRLLASSRRRLASSGRSSCTPCSRPTSGSRTSRRSRRPARVSRA